VEDLKRAAANRAVELVTDGMLLGLGSGTTARYATLRIAERLRQGDLHDISAVPTSEETARLARAEGIALTTLDEHLRLDLTIDGADEVDPQLDVVKGRHGYLLREKIVAAASRREVIVVDESKLVERLGLTCAVPVEVVRFGWRVTQAALERTGAQAALRVEQGRAYCTEEDHYIVDCVFPGGIAEPHALQDELLRIPGVIDTGLFLDLVHAVVVATVQGVQILTR